MSKRYMKRLAQDILMGICTIAVWAVVFSMMFTSWAEHPAERPVSGIEYMEEIGGIG